MSKGQITSEMEFIVKEKSENNRVIYNDKIHYIDCRWFEKSEGEKKGLQFIIPIEHPEYSSTLEDKLDSFTKFDRVSLRLKSMNERDTKWICEELVEW